MPTAALLALTAAGTVRAATPDPDALATATPGGGFTLGNATSGVDVLPTLALPPTGTLLADTRILTAAPTGKCQFGDGYSIKGVARHSQRAGGDPVAYQTINVDFCWEPTTGLSGGWGGASAVTDLGKKLGIVQANGPENDVKWVPWAGNNRKLIVESESVFSKPGLLGRDYGAGMSVEVSFPPGGSSPQVVCTASFDGDPALARCADNRGGGNQGDGTQKKEDGDRSWWGAELWRKLFGGGN